MKKRFCKGMAIAGVLTTALTTGTALHAQSAGAGGAGAAGAAGAGAGGASSAGVAGGTLPGTATSAFGPGAAVIPGGAGVALEALPAVVQGTVRSQVGTGRIGSIVPQGQGTYVVSYDANGRPTTILIGADGRILRAGTTAPGIPAAGTQPGGALANAPEGGQPASPVKLDDLPEAVRSSLKTELGSANVQFIDRDQRASGEVFIVGARTETNYVQVTLDESGKVLRDTRDIAVIAVGAAPIPELDSSVPFQRVPLVVQNAVKAYAAASDVRSVNLGLEQGKTVYDVVFMQDGRRDRLILAKDGSLLRHEEDVSAAFDNGKKTPRLAIGDLPPEVRDTIRRQTAHVMVNGLAMKQLGNQVVYSVRYQTNGAPVELLVDSHGVMIVPETPARAQDLGSPRVAPAPAGKPELVEVVPTNEAAEAAGAPATAERAARDSNASAPDSAPLQKVTLSDVPVPVQTSAKKLAGRGVIESINPTLGDAGVIYEVTFSTDGARRTLRLNKDGIVQAREDSEAK